MATSGNAEAKLQLLSVSQEVQQFLWVILEFTTFHQVKTGAQRLL